MTLEEIGLWFDHKLILLLALLLLAAAAASGYVLLVDAVRRRGAALRRIGRMRRWLGMIESWEKEGIGFERMRERLVLRVGLDMCVSGDEQARQEVREAFAEFLAAWNNMAIDEKFGGEA